MEDRKFAVSILVEAGRIIGTERGNQHGGAEDSFKMIGDMWSAYINNAISFREGYDPGIKLTPFDVAQMMVQLKQARAVFGDPKNVDNFYDAAGYTALAGSLKKAERDANDARDDAAIAEAVLGNKRVIPKRGPRKEGTMYVEGGVMPTHEEELHAREIAARYGADNKDQNDDATTAV